MKKIIAAVVVLSAAIANAGVPVKWTVETSRADTQEIELFHGETLDIEVQFKSYGQILQLPTNEVAMTYWQTNGMGTAYWRTNNVTIVASNGIMRSSFVSAMDVGAKTLRGFMGIAGNIYRASFVLRFKDAPGYDTTIVEWPYRLLDFNTIQVANEPYYKKTETYSKSEVVEVTEEKANEAATNALWKANQLIWGERLGIMGTPVADYRMYGYTNNHEGTYHPIYMEAGDFGFGVKWQKNETDDNFLTYSDGVTYRTTPKFKKVGNGITNEWWANFWVGESKIPDRSYLHRVTGTNVVMEVVTNSLGGAYECTTNIWKDGDVVYMEMKRAKAMVLYNVIAIGEEGDEDGKYVFNKASYEGRRGSLFDVNIVVKLKSETVKEEIDYEVEEELKGNSNRVASASAIRKAIDEAVMTAGSVTPEIATNIAANVIVRDVPEWARAATKPSETDPTVPAWAKEINPPVSMTDNAVVLTNGTLETKSGTDITAAHIGAATTDDIKNATNAVVTAADAAYYPKSQGEAWSSYWDGDDVRVTVTNYDSAVNLPSFYLEQRTNETALATNLFKTVWTEMGHWDKFLGTNWNWSTAWEGFKDWRDEVEEELDEKADRAWGFYNSHTGTYSPAGYTQISSSNILIASGMAYQKTATATADVWILTANEPYEPTGISTNGGFQIKDADGNVQFEIVKGDKTTVAAQAHAVSVTNSTLYVVYNIVAAQHPTAEVCLDLSTAAWKTETAADCPATVAWTGSSGRYVAAITPTAATTKCFVKATYQRGGDTYINNRCAVGMSKLVLNGTTYTLGTATISGNTVLTLTPEN